MKYSFSDRVRYKLLAGFLLLMSLCVTPQSSRAQLLETILNINLTSGNLTEDLQQLQKHTGFPFAYELSGLPSSSQKRSFRNEKLRVVLEYLLEGTGCSFEERHDIVLIGPARKSPKKATAYVFNGWVEDKTSGEKMEGVAIYDASNINTTAITGEEGAFRIGTDSAVLTIRLNYMGYKPLTVTLRHDDSRTYPIGMEIALNPLDSAVLVRQQDLVPGMASFKMPYALDRLSFLPGFNGNLDLITLTKFTPGIQEANDGLGSFIVRGGAPDQNLFLLDGAPIYGQTHLMGLASTVNAKAVKEVSILKGTVSPRYSGGVSSIWNIALKNGDLEKYHGSVSLGTGSSDIMLEGPIVKNKTSLLVTGRMGYPDLYLRSLKQKTTFQYEDLLVRLYHQFSNKDQLSLTAYTSADQFKFSYTPPFDSSKAHAFGTVVTYCDMGYQTKNRAASLNWRHYSSWNIVSDISLVGASYQAELRNQFDYINYVLPSLDTVLTSQRSRLKNGLYDLTAKWNVKYTMGNAHSVYAGAYYTKHFFYPQETVDVAATYPSKETPPYTPDPVSDLGGFIEDQWELNTRWKLKAGLHINDYVYRNGSYFSIQPRIHLSYLMGKQTTLYASYIRVQQCLNRIETGDLFIPVSIWTSSDNYIKPQISDQLSLGVNRKLFDGAVDISIESYFKVLRNILDYPYFDTIQPPTNDPQARFFRPAFVGTGNAYGIEFGASKPIGNLRIWLSYALGWSNRRFAEINKGLPFAYNYARRHSLNLVNVYKINRNLELSVLFSFQSKPPERMFMVRDGILAKFSPGIRENYEAQTQELAYHRLDIGVNYNAALRNGIRSIWNLSILNVYNQQNPFFYAFNFQDGERPGRTLLPITVSASYTVNF